MTGKLIIFSAPSGSGKSTIVQWLMSEHPELNLAFSISATTRAPRGTEKNGVEYLFLTPEEFKDKISHDEFLEYEEVYANRFYGTLKSQVESQTEKGENVVFDVDVKGGCNIKKHYGTRALSIFVQPPSIEELRRRLVHRATDAPEVIEQRLAKAAYELTFAKEFDHIVVNDDLEKAKQDTYRLVSDFLKAYPDDDHKPAAPHRHLRGQFQPHTRGTHRPGEANPRPRPPRRGLVLGVAAEPFQEGGDRPSRR